MYSCLFYTQVRQHFVYLFSIFPFFLLLELKGRVGVVGRVTNEAWPVLCGGILSLAKKWRNYVDEI